MSNLKIAGVVVLYEPTDDDISNINSYLDYIDYLYVVDNSQNKNIERLHASEKIEYIFNNGNLGLSEPYNNTCDLARKKGYKWLLTMDQDSIFHS